LSDLRRSLFLGRHESPLFDTKRWVRNIEKGYAEAWRRWVVGAEFEDSAEWGSGDERLSGCIWVADDSDDINYAPREKYFVPES
jgi:hypothetical protein